MLLYSTFWNNDVSPSIVVMCEVTLSYRIWALKSEVTKFENSCVFIIYLIILIYLNSNRLTTLLINNGELTLSLRR